MIDLLLLVMTVCKNISLKPTKNIYQVYRKFLFVVFSCSLLFLPIFSIKITIHILWWALISRFLSFFILCCVGIFCVSYLSLYHHLFIYHSQTTTNITQHMFVVNASSELLPPFPGGIQLLTNYLIAKKEQKKKRLR